MLYIPIVPTNLKQLLQPDSDKKAIIATLETAGLAAVLLIQKLPALSLKAPSDTALLKDAEQLLAKIISLYNDVALVESQELITSTFSNEQFTQGAALLENYSLYLMSDEQIHTKQYLTLEGHWDYGFKQRQLPDFVNSRLLARHSLKSCRVSHEEERVLNVILADRDEPLDIQGYAGSGKTWLIAQLVDALGVDKTAFLAETWAQVSALKDTIREVRGDIQGVCGVCLSR